MENFQQKFQENITRSLEIGIKEPVYRWGPVKITWRPELGTGQIDIIETKGMNFYDLKEFWEKVRTELPEAKWELNPDKAIKDRIYAMLFKGDPQITRSGDEGMRAKGREGFILDNSKFNVNNLEGKELRKHASDWLFDNPGKDLGDWAGEFEYTGPRLQQKGLLKNGKPRISWRSVNSDAKYNETVKPQTELEAANLLEEKAKAKALNEDLIHQQLAPKTAKGGLHKAQADHFQYPKGSDPLRRVGVLDAQQNLTKKNAEEIHRSRKAEGVIVDIDDVSGETILAPDVTHNPYETHKSRGAVVIPDGADAKTINAAFDQVETFNKFIRRSLGVAATATAGVIANPLKTLAAIPDVVPVTYAFDALSLGVTQLDKWGTQQLPDDHVYESGATKQQALNFLNRQIGADVVGLEPTGIGNIPAVIHQQTDPRETEEQKRERSEQAIENVRTMQQHGMTPWF